MLRQPRPAPEQRQKIIVGLSGGVDSSVAALLLKQQGYAVEGLFMKNWEEDDTQSYCAAAEDVKDARAISASIGIELRTVNFSIEYWEQVFSECLSEFERGRTPNPDILCNREIKFNAFLAHAMELGADAIATGHYARIRYSSGTYQLLKGLDSGKDQSYFLYALNQSQLAQSLFPLGELRKAAVRELARQAGLVTHDKKDSTGICFVGERPFRQFLSRYLPAQPGPIKTVDGATVGRHAGAIYYTIGQRKGLGVGGVRDAGDAPWFVVAKDLEHNVLLVAQGHDHPLLYSRTLKAGRLHWISGEAPPATRSLRAKTRYRQPDQSCRIVALDPDCCTVAFDQAQRAVTPGQSIVFYDGDVCLGGGIIDTAE